jgi:hypothetical protein
MNASIRPYGTASVATTASVALVAAGLIGVSPVAPRMTDLHVPAAVQLTAASDPITAWVDVFNTSRTNFANLGNAWLAEPLPVVRQVLSNQLTYLLELPDVGKIAAQIFANIGAGLAAPFVADPDLINADHALLFATASAIVASNPTLSALVSFLASPASGILIGAVGTVVSPVLALIDSVTTIFNDLSVGDLASAVNNLINIPAAVTGAFLNGYGSIDLTGLVNSAVGDLLPRGTNVTAELALGGLLSPAGSLFNSLGVTAKVLGVPVPGFNFAAVPAGPIGSLIAMTNAIAEAIKTVPPAPAAPTVDSVGDVPQSITGQKTMFTLSTTENGPASDTDTASSEAATTGKVDRTASEAAKASKSATVTDENDAIATAADTDTTASKGATVTDENDAIATAADTDTAASKDDGTDATEKQSTPHRGKAVRDSLKATPGETAGKHRNDVGEGVEKVVKSAGDQLNSAVSKIDKKLKKGADKKAEASAE